MKTVTSLAVACLGALLASGCATTDQASYSSQAAPPKAGEILVDGRYVAAVESLAKQRGTRVVWVNRPTKRVSGPIATAD